MGRERINPEPEQEAGAPEWMVTYSDCMTLLLTFFVLLLSFSSFDAQDLLRLKNTFTKEFSSLSTVHSEKTALAAPNVIKQNDILNKGSEKPTLARGAEDNLAKKTQPEKFHDHKVFLSPSETIFWGNGTVISFQGRKALADMASFLKEVPDRVVVSENGQGDEGNSEHLGQQRAWAVIKYFTTKQGLGKERFSLAVDTLQKSYEIEPQNSPQAKPARTLEIVLLERSIYN